MSKRHALFILYAVVVAVILGVLAGWFFGPVALKFSWMGTLFLNALKMVVVPLIIAAIISGIASLGDIRKLGKPGSATLIYFMVTMMVSATVGMVLAEILRPGHDFHLTSTAAEVNINQSVSMGDVLLSLISPNIVASATNFEILPLIVFSMIFGAALTVIGEKGRLVTDFFESLNNIMMVIVGWVMILSPFGVFALVSTPIAEAGGGAAVIATFSAVGAYMGTVLIGLIIQSILLFILLYLFARQGLSYLRNMIPALVTAMSTSSSSATVPLSMECAENSGLAREPIRLVIPLGSTVNMNGTAVYQGVATIFLAQVYNIDIGFADHFLIALTAAMAAIGSAGIPQGGHVMTLMLFSVVGIPVEGFGLILAVDWILDRARTTLNVWGDLVGAALINRLMFGKTNGFDA
ncbi:MAG: dicarboxylate/amino acid:cation symporter [Emcibacteraceae bacterium]